MADKKHLNHTKHLIVFRHFRTLTPDSQLMFGTINSRDNFPSHRISKCFYIIFAFGGHYSVIFFFYQVFEIITIFSTIWLICQLLLLLASDNLHRKILCYPRRFFAVHFKELGSTVVCGIGNTPNCQKRYRIRIADVCDASGLHIN